MHGKAPLCGTCHNLFGANPAKRKVIRESRDNWYEICRTRFTEGANKIDEVSQKIDDLATLVTPALIRVAQSQRGSYRFIGGPFAGPQQLQMPARGLPEFLGMPVTAERMPVRAAGDKVWGRAMYNLNFDGEEVTYVFLRFQANNVDDSTPVKLCSNQDLAKELGNRANFCGLIISTNDDHVGPPESGQAVGLLSHLDPRSQLAMIEAVLP